MKNRELKKLLECLSFIPDEAKREEATKIIMTALYESIALETIKKVSSIPKKEESEEKGAFNLKFTNKEIEKMPKTIQHMFAVNDIIVTCRVIDGKYYQARYRRDGLNVSAGAKDLTQLKTRFVKKFEQAVKIRDNSRFPRFDEYLEEWLSVKKHTIKETTYGSYEALVKRYLLPKFGDRQVNEIQRKDIQEFLLKLFDENKKRTAQKLRQILNSIFLVLSEDYDIKNPIKKVELPHFDTVKGRALSKEEELQMIKGCMSNNMLGNSAALLLLYTGMRVGELRTIKVYDDYLTCISEKTRRGYAEEVRKIPFSPMLKRVIGMIDFEKAKNASNSVVRDALKKVFADHHVHEFRYTFITRAKECGINHEVIMLWTGHKSDSDVRTSKVDRGYTTYSDEYMNSEMLKYNYELKAN